MKTNIIKGIVIIVGVMILAYVFHVQLDVVKRIETERQERRSEMIRREVDAQQRMMQFEIHKHARIKELERIKKTYIDNDAWSEYLNDS